MLLWNHRFSVLSVLICHRDFGELTLRLLCMCMCIQYVFVVGSMCWCLLELAECYLCFYAHTAVLGLCFTVLSFLLCFPSRCIHANAMLPFMSFSTVPGFSYFSHFPFSCLFSLPLSVSYILCELSHSILPSPSTIWHRRKQIHILASIHWLLCSAHFEYIWTRMLQKSLKMQLCICLTANL